MAIGDTLNQNPFGTNFNPEEEERNKAELAAQGAMMGADVPASAFGQAPAPAAAPFSMEAAGQVNPMMEQQSLESFAQPQVTSRDYDVPTPIADSVGQYSQVNPMMEQQSLTPSEPSFAPTPVTNVGLMGEPLREQPSVEEIRRRANQTGIFGQPLPPGAIENNQENIAGFQGLLSGLGRVFTDPTGSKMQAERYGVPAPAETQISMSNPMMQQQPLMSSTPMVDSAVNYGVGPFTPGAIDFSKPPTTNVPSGTAQPSGITMGADGVINLPALTRESELGSAAPEATFLRADGSIGEIFPGQRIGDAFPGNPDTPLVGSPLVPGQQTYQGADLPGGTGFVRAPEGMVKTIGPDGRMIFATQEQANAIASSMNGPASAGPATPSAPGPAAPGGPQSRLGEFGEMISNNADRILDVARPFAPSVTGAIDLYRNRGRIQDTAEVGLDYLTDPRQPTLKTLADEKAAEGAIPQGQPGSVQDNFVKRMATGQPLTQAETASAIQFARSKGLNFDPVTGYSQAPMATGPRMMTAEFRDANGDGIEDRTGDPRGGPLGPVTLPRGSAANQPTMSSLNAMTGTAPMATAPQGRPALSAYEQASMDREARIAGRQLRPGETQTQRDTRIAQSRTQRSSQGGPSQADARDLAQGMAKGATEGERMRALQIQSRLGLGAFRQGTPRVDKLSQATSTVDRMISGGQLSPEKRNAAIQKIMGVGSLDNTAGAAGAGVIGSAEFDRVSSQLQPGGALHREGIRVDPSRVDPNTGAALIYKENDGGYLGFSFEEPVSPELIQQLLPYARALRKPGVGDFAGMGMQVNQFAGSR